MENINVENLIVELTEAAQAYYQNDIQLMTDEEYDTKTEYLENLVNQGELQLSDELADLLNKVAAGSTPEGKIVIHDVPMLSLGKAKDYDELKSYHTKTIKAGAKGFILETKLDGLAMSAKYVDGKITQLATRGDGVKGESLNHLLNNKNIKIVGLPGKLNKKQNLEIRGELYISDKQFEVVNKNRKKVTGEEFANSRNAVVGIVRGAEKGLHYKAEISFTAYSVFQDGKQVNFDDVLEYENLSRADNNTLQHLLAMTPIVLANNIVNSTDFDKLKDAVEKFGEARKNLIIPTDGVVIKPINEIEMLNKMGFTSRHPNAFIAFKYPGEKVITVVEDIIVSVGKTGKLTPQAKVKPVAVDGVIISNITCHNYSWLNTMGIRPGATVAVTRANDVIPAIDVVIDKGPNDPVEVPANCPECGELLQGDGTDLPKTLTCTNLECPSRFLFHMKSLVGRDYLYLEGLGNVALEALINENIIKSIVDIFKLDEETLAKVPTGITSTGNVRMLGAGNAKNIMISINEAMNNTDSNKLLASLNIEGMGPNTAKRLIAHFGGVENVLKVDPERLTEVDQVGQSLVNSFKEHGQRALGQLNELIKLGFKINDPIKKDNQGKKGTFSVSGSVEGFANRNEFVEYMENNGWEFHRNPKKDTDILFADPNGTSSKIKKARDNGTKIINNLKDL